MAVNVAPLLGAHDLSVQIDFLLFAVTLACVAIFHRHTLAAALTGLGAITLKKLLGEGFAEGAGLAGLFAHFAHEWILLANLFLLLVGLLYLHAISRQAASLTGCRRLYRIIGPVVSCF